MTDLEKQIREIIKNKSQEIDPVMGVNYQNDAIHFIRGALFILPLLMEAIEQRNSFTGDSRSWLNELNEPLITLLKGEAK